MPSRRPARCVDSPVLPSSPRGATTPRLQDKVNPANRAARGSLRPSSARAKGLQCDAMTLLGKAKRIRIYVKESDVIGHRPAAYAVLDWLRREGAAGAT